MSLNLVIEIVADLLIQQPFTCHELICKPIQHLEFDLDCRAVAPAEGAPVVP